MLPTPTCCAPIRSPLLQIDHSHPEHPALPTSTSCDPPELSAERRHAAVKKVWNDVRSGATRIFTLRGAQVKGVLNLAQLAPSLYARRWIGVVGD